MFAKVSAHIPIRGCWKRQLRKRTTSISNSPMLLLSSLVVCTEYLSPTPTSSFVHIARPRPLLLSGVATSGEETDCLLQQWCSVFRFHFFTSNLNSASLPSWCDEGEISLPVMLLFLSRRGPPCPVLSLNTTTRTSRSCSLFFTTIRFCVYTIVSIIYLNLTTSESQTDCFSGRAWNRARIQLFRRKRVYRVPNPDPEILTKMTLLKSKSSELGVDSESFV